MDGAGPIIVLVFLVVGSVIVGLYVFAYASHIFFSVVEATAAGADDVAWPDSPYVDWIWKGVFLAWLMSLGLPLLVVTRLISGNFFPFVALGLWALFFPLMFLSALGAPSRWFVFWPAVIWGLVRKSFDWLLFTIASSVVVVGALATMHWNVSNLYLLGVPVAAIVLACALLIYARLLGRLAWIVQLGAERYAAPEPERALRRRDHQQAQLRAASYDPLREGQRIRQPSEMPPTAAKDPEARTGYDMRTETADVQTGLPPHKQQYVIDPPTPYEIADGPAHIAPDRGPLPERYVNPSDYERHLARSLSQKTPELPAHPWMSGTWSFPFRNSNYAVLASLIFAFTAFGCLIKMVEMLLPK